MTDPRLIDACGDRPGWACERIWDATHNQTLSKLGDFVVHTPLKILLIIIGAVVVNRIAQRSIRRFVNTLAGRATSGILSGTPANPRAGARTQTIGIVLRSLATATIYSFTAMLILGEVGINLGPLIAGAGIAGVALGFGAQSLVKDFLSGIFMLIEDQYGVGDVIDVGQATGMVEAIGLRVTQIRDLSGTLWYVRNGEVQRVGNMTQGWSRARVEVLIASDGDVERAKQVLQEAAEDIAADEDLAPHLLGDPEVTGFEDLSAESVRLRLMIKVAPAQQWVVQRALRGRIRERFAAAKIPLALPRREVVHEVVVERAGSDERDVSGERDGSGEQDGSGKQGL